VREALRRLGRDDSPAAVAGVVDAIARAAGDPDRPDAPGVDCDRAIHRATYLRVFADAELDDDLAQALYAVESDPAGNPFAVDVEPVLRSIPTQRSSGPCWTPPAATLMVGDRVGPDGGAHAVGMPTLLLPTLTDVHECRLGLVAGLLGVPTTRPRRRASRR
jgi:hypothetical protein